MPLSAGTRLGPYEIVSPLGAGGMGEVYRARDTRLGRDVAVKVLLPEVSADDARRRRFEQEARSASALNHPNIVAVYDVGSVDSMTYLAMELVEGRTLRELLVDGALPARKLLDVAVQVADGLAKAHEAGLVHRDLKPENLIVSKDGFVKILDFGLAKLTEMTSSDGVSALATMAGAPGTIPGTVMGTVGYMSPEQASGRDVDFRSDQFAFGSILYELATGKRAFQRNTGAETLTAIIREEPQPLGQVNPRVPAPVRWIVERCLAKEPEERFASTKDLARDLRSLRDHLSETSVSEAIAPASPARRGVPRWLAAAIGLVVGAAAAIGGLRLLERDRPYSARDLQRLTFRRGSVLSARFAPDGRSVVYSAAWEGKPSELFTTRPESPESRALGLSPASLLSISPAGDLAVSIGWRPLLGWETVGTLARVSLEGGAPREVLENVGEADWSPDGKELAVVRDAGPMRRLEYPIGKVLHETVGWLSHPRVSPDGNLVAFLDHPQRGDNLGRVLVLDRAGKKKVEGPQTFLTGLSWAPGGREVWYTGASLDAVTLSGKVRTVQDLLGTVTIHDVGSDGRVLLSRNTWRREIVGLAPGQTAERNLTWLDWSFPTALSEDGQTVLFDEQNLPSYLSYLRRTDGGPAVLLGNNRSADLSPDGKWALVGKEDGTDLTLVPTGAGQPRKLQNLGMRPQQSDFFPDGRRILISGSEPGRGLRLYVYDIDGAKAKALTPEGVNTINSDPVAPDGRSAFAFGPDRRLMIYPTEPGEPRAVPGFQAEDVPIRWTSDGRAIWVFKPNEVPTKIYGLDVTTGERTLWKELTPPDPAGVLQIGPIQMTPDGKSYVYSYRRTLDELFLVEGLK
jgi:eukaryotic-like serine/threonine-protein kinase